MIDPTEAMTCPECVSKGRTGLSRIGNRRRDCTMCNRYGAAVHRGAMALLKAKHPRAYERALKQARISVYLGLVSQLASRGYPVDSPTQLVPPRPPEDR